MDNKEEIKKILRNIKNQEHKSTKTISYKGDRQVHNAYDIDLSLLRFNPIMIGFIHSPVGEKLKGKCEECGSKRYTEWDYESKKCPQCEDGIIGESDGGVLIMAD